MKSPQVVRTRIASGNMAKKSPARSRSKLSSKGKENMGISSVSSKVTKSKDTKVRPVPDFGKLHKKWESKLNVNKAQAKKPLTVVQEFDFTKPCMKKEFVQQKPLNTQKSDILQKKSHPKEQEFKSDKAALKSIISNKGVLLPNGNKSRSTLATISLNKIAVSPEKQQKSVADCERDSFGTLANIQQEAGIDFEEDTGALQSILDSTGITDNDLKSKNLASVVNNPMRQTIDCGGEFKAPLAMTPRQVPQVRRSIYYKGPTGKEFSKQFIYSEFARRMASRLTLDANAPKPAESEVASSAPKVVQQRNSIYVKVDYGNIPKGLVSPSREIRADPKTPMSERKAQRIIMKTPSKSPATRVLSKSTSKKNIMQNWADLLGPRSPAVKDKIQVKLFEDDESCMDENQPLAINLDEDAQRLTEIKEVEKKLQKEIEQMESSKKQTKEQQPSVIVIDKNSPAYNRPAPSTPSRDNTKSTTRAASDSAVTNNGQETGQKRMVLGELNVQEVFERSSPSYRERGRSRNKVKSAPTFASCVFGENSSKSKKVHFETPNVLKHPESPSARYHKNCASPTSSLGNLSLESPKASRVSALKRPGRYSPMGRSPKARDYSPTSRLRDNQVYNIMMEIDKENRSPIRPALVAKKPNVVITPSKKTIIREEKDEFIVEYDVLDQIIQDMSIQELNRTMSESVVTMEGLQTEAESLMEQSNLDETNADNLLEQLEVIQKKQQELVQTQKALQLRLEQCKKKKRLNFDKQQTGGSKECQVSKKLVQGIKKQEASVTKKADSTEFSRKELSKNEVTQKKKQLSERNVVDVSPISMGPVSSGFNNGFGSNVFLTPENQNANESDYENSPTLFPINKNRSLRQPLHSTAHESQHHMKLDESTTEMFVSPVKDKMSQGGALSQGLLQMAQSLNATPHKNLHWKKQLLPSKEDSSSENIEHGKVPEDSFYENGDTAKTPTDVGQQTPVRSMQPIGTPFSFCNTITPKILTTPRSERKTPISYSPKALFSGSAQLLVNSPIRTPLALREAVSGSKEASPVSNEEISIDASPDSCVEEKVKLSSPVVVKKEKVTLASLPNNSGSLSLSANLMAKGSPTAFRIVPRSKPMCSDLQGTLLSKVKVKYMDALLDDEVALYTSRLQLASKMSFGIRCCNPVTKILEEGDEFHFIPIVEPIRSPPRFMPSVGSAFSSSSAFRQIRL